MGNRKIKVILPDTLGDPKLYPALNGLSNLLNELDNKNKQRYVCSLVNEFNTSSAKTEKIEDKEFRSFVLTLLKGYFVDLVDTHIKLIHPDIHSHTRNFVIAKSRKMIRDTKPPVIEKEIKYYTCGIFLIDKTNRFLVAHPTNATDDKWSIPKGYKDPEETALEAAKREFLEETAIDIDTLNCELLFECHNIRYKDNRKALSAFFFKTDEIIDLNTCRCDSMVIKEGIEPFPENDKFAMFDWSNLELIHYTQRTAVNIFQQAQNKK